MCENKKSLKMITKSQSSSNKYPHIAKVKLFEQLLLFCTKHKVFLTKNLQTSTLHKPNELGNLIGRPFPC